MRVLVCGDRHWSDPSIIERELVACMDNGRYGPHDMVVIEGEARGADILGRFVADTLGIPVLRFPADWRHFGRAAGPIRNQTMLDDGRPDLVLAFHNDIAHSKGTADMVRRARAAGIEVRVISDEHH